MAWHFPCYVSPCQRKGGDILLQASASCATKRSQELHICLWLVLEKLWNKGKERKEKKKVLSIAIAANRIQDRKMQKGIRPSFMTRHALCSVFLDYRWLLLVRPCLTTTEGTWQAPAWLAWMLAISALQLSCCTHTGEAAALWCAAQQDAESWSWTNSLHWRLSPTLSSKKLLCTISCSALKNLDSTRILGNTITHSSDYQPRSHRHQSQTSGSCKLHKLASCSANPKQEGHYLPIWYPPAYTTQVSFGLDLLGEGCCTSPTHRALPWPLLPMFACVQRTEKQLLTVAYSHGTIVIGNSNEVVHIWACSWVTDKLRHV